MNFCFAHHQGSHLGLAFLGQGFWFLMTEWLEFGVKRLRIIEKDKMRLLLGNLYLQKREKNREN